MRGWPASLTGRVAALLVAGLALASGLSWWSAMRERSAQADAMMLAYVSSDVTASLAVLDRLPADERPAWLERLSRPHYRFKLEDVPAAATAEDEPGRLAAALAAQLGPARVQAVRAAPQAADGSVFALRLADGTPLTLWLQPPVRSMRIEAWLTGLAQVLVLGLAVVLAVRVATRPLARLATAAIRLGDDPAAPPVDERGPSEVRHAAAALNRMRERIAAQAAERLQILAAVSHDLRTPLTRMRVRCELLPEGALRDKLQADLAEMQHLVAEGLALAATDHAAQEPAQALDLVALLDTMVCDYTDTDRTVRWQGDVTPPDAPILTTRPQALRRLVTNLLDNAVKFAGAAELSLQLHDDDIVIAVLDRGPGIAPERLAEAMRPFARLEPSRSREHGGTGLGLAIAQRLAHALGGRLVLAPREGGGLQAALTLPRVTSVR
jgi:signal transduction histidine kinase